jgi:hypothetical protein
VSVRGGEVDFESVACGEDGGLFDLAGGADDVGLFVPLGFGDGELFADFDLRVVDGEADDVDLEPFGG